jgi:uncharacterized membrane protein
MSLVGGAAPAVLASFLASFVECVEALTVVLAVGAVRGWRSALAGAGAGLVLLAGLLAVAGRAVAALPVRPVQIVIGALLLAFGLRWLRKALRRAWGSQRKRDEVAAYEATSARLRDTADLAKGWDGAAVATSLQIVLVEGIEVIFIVVSLAGANRTLLAPSATGAGLALLVVAGLGVTLQRPLAAVPENTMKLFTALLLCGIAVFMLGEGFGIV